MAGERELDRGKVRQVSKSAGITAYGAYIPRLRLSRASIAKAHAWAMPALGKGAKGERSMRNWDEDSITMAVEAARDCLNGSDRDKIESVFFASTTSPFLDRQNAGVVGAALDLDSGIYTLDTGGSQRAATSALIAALKAAGEGETLLAAADAREAKPASVQEMRYGHGGVALTLGHENVVARLLAQKTLSADFVDHYRGEGEDVDYGWEERWVRDEGYLKIVPQAVEALLESAGVDAGDIDHFILPCSIRRVPEQIAKRLGLREEAIRDGLQAECGDTGVVHPLLMLVHALEDAEPGQKILVVGFGQGADVLLFETTDALKQLSPRAGVTGALARGQTEEDYMKFLSFSDQVKLDWGMRAETDNKTALTTEYRNKDMITGFMGGKCSQCGTVQYPRTRYCVNPNCKAKDTQEPESFADTPAKVMSFTADWLSYNPSPPYVYGQVQFESGGRVLMGFTDTDPGQVEVGTPLKMMFRVKDFDKDRGYRRYFWKAMPEPTEQKEA